MKQKAIVAILAVVMAAACASGGGEARPRAGATPQEEIAAFNQRFDQVILAMNHAEVMALWAEDGVDLLPGMAAMSGKATIAKWLDETVAQLKGYRVMEQKTEYHDVQVAGDWATEWGMTHQVVQPPDGQPVIEANGKILLVLHREKSGQWKIAREMWNAAPEKKAN